MKPKTLKALKASIEHWERLVRLEPGEEVGSEACPLCRLFNNDNSTFPCHGCPVSEKSGEIYCVGTPYVDADNAWWEYRYFTQTRASARKFQAAARKELEFLKSLLPKK